MSNYVVRLYNKDNELVCEYYTDDYIKLNQFRDAAKVIDIPDDKRKH